MDTPTPDNIRQTPLELLAQELDMPVENLREAAAAPAPTPDNTTMKLGDEFDAALLGATIRGQFAYSLTRLAMIVMQDMHVHPEVAQKMVAEQVVTVMREHGDEAPVFIDDSLMFGADIAVESEEEATIQEVGTSYEGTAQPIFTGEPEPQSQSIFTGESVPPQPILTGEKPDNVILIPGVTHGSVKGFLDPNGLHS